MKHDGIDFRFNPTIGFRQNEALREQGGYVEFFYKKSGMVIPLDDGGIPGRGYSKTNMAYAADGRVLLAYGGYVYTAPKRSARSAA